ncbi:MAG TPA: recombination mediator RecR [Bacteroidales bacterium]|nr:recombination mediator RecR [Bacteroidales bacterium]
MSENVKLPFLLNTGTKLNYSSKLLESAVNELSRLPGIGRKTALRLALHLVRQDEEAVVAFSGAVLKLRQEIQRCSQCHNISDNEICDICANIKRDHQLVCVVQDIRDVMAIENTGQYNGVYHVLNGIISPIDGIGPEDLTINSLLEKISREPVREVILALPTTVEGDTTNYYLSRKLAPFQIILTAIARGIAIGDDIEFADEITLGRSIINRVPFTIPGSGV